MTPVFVRNARQQDVIVYLAKLYKFVYIVYMAEVIIRGIDEKLRNAFKAWCVEMGSTMKAELVKYMTQIVEERKKAK